MIKLPFVAAWIRGLFLLCLLAGLPLLAGGQATPPPADDSGPTANRPLPAVRLPDNAAPPIIDGDISDAVWKTAARARTFFDPTTSKPTADQTEAYLLYDAKYLYVAFHAHDSKPDQIVARETVRDANLDNDDNVRIELDPFLTYKSEDYAVFWVNAIGTRRTRVGGGRADKVEWQGDWDASVKRVADGWTAEMRIPWEILTYPRSVGKMNIGINFRRQQQRTRIESLWSDLGPQLFNEREGQWQGVQPPARAWHPRLSFLPYVLPIGGRRTEIRTGVDARFQPSPELTMVGTLNPDFASVEGAVLGVAFSRAERFVPDRRPFFLEGRDYITLGEDFQIGSFFNSNRITQVDAGGKMYGKINPTTTIGALGTLAVGQQANFVGQIRREINATSNVSVMLLQRLAPGEDNTVLAISPNIRRGKWSVDGQAVQTAGPDAGGMAWTGAVNLSDKNFFSTIRYRRVGRSFLDRLGYVPFVDYHGFSSYNDWGTQWRHGYLRNFDVNLYPQMEWHLDGRRFRHRINGGVSFETRDDIGFGVNFDGGTFDNQHDFTWGGGFTSGVTNRFRQWGVNFTTGTQADRPYTSFGPSLSFRLGKRFDLALGSFVQNYNGLTQQHILNFNYQINPYQSWGGRMVVEDAGTNLYLSYRNAGRKGLETYIIIGDPNAHRITQRILLKLVFAI